MPKKTESSEIAQALLVITERLDKLEQNREPVKEVTAPVADSKFPVPFEYQELVKTMLNGKFTVEIDYSIDTSAFTFAILVPREYSNAGTPHWEMYHEDRRSKVILNALGINGVREWVQKVYDSFDVETRSKIANDRAQLV